jgi:hypothetical protein
MSRTGCDGRHILRAPHRGIINLPSSRIGTCQGRARQGRGQTTPSPLGKPSASGRGKGYPPQFIPPSGTTRASGRVGAQVPPPPPPPSGGPSAPGRARGTPPPPPTIWDAESLRQSWDEYPHPPPPHREGPSASGRARGTPHPPQTSGSIAKIRRKQFRHHAAADCKKSQTI